MINWAQKINLVLSFLNQNDRSSAINEINNIIDSSAQRDHGHKHWMSLTKIAMAVGDAELAVRTASLYISDSKSDIARIIFAAGIFAECRQFALALKTLDKISKSQQKDPMIAHLRGTLYMQNNKLDLAESHFRQALAIRPNSGVTWFSLVNLKKYKAKNNRDLIKLQNHVPKIGAESVPSQASYLYSLGKINHDIGRFDDAFSAYLAGAQRMKSISKYNRKMDLDNVDSIIEQSSKQTQNETASYTSTIQPIFIMGNPRSGSTLCEQILSAHTNVSSGGELNIFSTALKPHNYMSLWNAPPQNRNATFWNKIAAEYIRLITYLAAKAPFIVDKTLNHTRYLPWLLSAFPKAKFVWTQRNPHDTALSCYRTYFGQGLDWTYDLADIGHHFKAEDKLYKHFSTKFSDRFYTLSYGNLVQNPDTEINNLIDYCGLTPQDNVHKFYENDTVISTASVVQAREAISKSSLGGWKKYEKHFAEFSNIIS